MYVHISYRRRNIWKKKTWGGWWKIDFDVRKYINKEQKEKWRIISKCIDLYWLYKEEYGGRFYKKSGSNIYNTEEVTDKFDQELHERTVYNGRREFNQGM